MSIQRRGWMWMIGVAVLALVALLAVRWALSSPGRGAADRRAATAAAATDVAASGGTAVARAVAATLTADADALSASSAATPTVVWTPSYPPDLEATAPVLATATIAARGTRPPFATATRPAATAPPTEAPTEEADVSGAQWIGQRAEGGAVGDIWRLVDTRLGRHDGFTRIVWEFQADAAAPRWRVVERDMSAGAPSTLPQGALSGTAWLEVTFTDVIAMEAPQALAYQASPGGPVLTGVTMLRPPAGEEDDSSLGFAVGMARPSRFQMVALDDPARLVLDVFDSP